MLTVIKDVEGFDSGDRPDFLQFTNYLLREATEPVGVTRVPFSKLP